MSPRGGGRGLRTDGTIGATGYLAGGYSYDPYVATASSGSSPFSSDPDVDAGAFIREVQRMFALATRRQP